MVTPTDATCPVPQRPGRLANASLLGQPAFGRGTAFCTVPAFGLLESGHGWSQTWAVRLMWLNGVMSGNVEVAVSPACLMLAALPAACGLIRLLSNSSAGYVWQPEN